MVITRTTIRAALLLFFALLAAYFLWLVRGGLYPFIIAFFLAYLLNPAVGYLEGKGIKRVWAIAWVYVLLFACLFVVGSWLIPVLIRELEGFGQELPAMIAKGEELVVALQSQYQQSALPHSLRAALDNGLTTLQASLQSFVAGIVGGIMHMLTHFIGLAISPVLAFYLLHDWHELSAAVLRTLPARWRHETVLILRDVDGVLSGVIRGQVTVAIIVGILVSTGLYLLDVRYALIIGILAGALDIIPYFGAFIGATPAVTVALLTSPLLAFKVGLLFFVIHQLEGTVIGPKILGDNIGLHPLSVIMFLFIGEELGGLMGMLLGVPAGAVGKVLLSHLFRILI
ncbi:AI-2E family transporter [Anaeroselena agilis]|uniref:AI-2E family transporter n=1 Tax=Anaeroselena agilis TaxID=3063788 RepID=A0ABU3NW63_9FIRM|nr:AI-2E family transporter [Selenomonadales bacterium 4137-cl]